MSDDLKNKETEPNKPNESDALTIPEPDPPADDVDIVDTAGAGLPRRARNAIATSGLVLALLGLVVAPAYLCVVFVSVVHGDSGAVIGAVIGLALTLVTLGAGGVTMWHGMRALNGKPSRPIRLPGAWVLAGLFGLSLAVGWFFSQNVFFQVLFFPPALMMAASLPPLFAVAWFAAQRPEGLTWRRGLLAFAGGATLGVFVAIVLEILLPAIVLALVFELAEGVLGSLEQLFEALADENVAAAITSPGFIYLFIQLAIIAPLAEEFAKPLATLPLLRYLPRRTAFLVGAMAGAGFAALENLLYTGFGYSFWAGILLVRSLGAAIHPLGSGLVALGWRDVLRGERDAWANFTWRFGLAAGMHALWNGGSLLVITLAGADFFGELPPEINVLGLSAAGTTLALLLILGLTALWLGRTIANEVAITFTPGEASEGQFVLSDRAVAIWALACLVAIVPAGIAGLQLLL